MSRVISLFAIGTILLVSCSSSSVVTTYKNRDNHAGNVYSVLVAGIIATGDTVAGSLVEKYFSLELKNAGYTATSSSTVFGAKGLANLGQEETLMKLCNYGFDAVLTIALIDGSKEKYQTRPGTHSYVGNYYLDRIWNYEKIRANLSIKQNADTTFWECILFDLYSLQPLIAVQTRLYEFNPGEALHPDLAKKVIAKMMKEGVIRKRNAGKPRLPNQPIVKQ